MIRKIIRMFLNAIGIKRGDSSALSNILADVLDSYRESRMFAKLKRIPIPPINMANLSSYDFDRQKDIKNPLVRVCVLTYNNAKYARSNLDGILMQKTDFPFEIHIFDDCSTDGTSDIIREYAEKYPNIIPDIQPENIYGSNHKLWQEKELRAVKDHNSKYTAMADGDDYWTDPYKLQHQVEFLEKNPDYSMCCGGFLYNNDFNGAQKLESPGLMRKVVGLEYTSLTEDIIYNSFIKDFTCVYRTDAIPNWEVAQKYEFFRDVHMWYYTLLNGKGCYLTRIMGIANQNEGGIFMGLSNEKRATIELNVNEELYRETGEKMFKERHERFKKELELYKQDRERATRNSTTVLR